MKITFSNLGAIKKTTLDLRPLTVIIGPNNSNKTYIAYSIYGLLQTLDNNVGRFIYELNRESKTRNSISLKIDDSFFDKYVKDCEEKVREFTDELGVFFQDTSRKIFSKTNFKFHLNKRDVRKAFNQVLGEYLDYKFLFKNNLLTIILDADALLSDEDFEDKILDALAELIVGMRVSLFSNSFVLPAERNALIIVYKIMEGRRYKELKTRQRRLVKGANKNKQLSLLPESNDILYPQPIEDFLNFLLDIEVELKPRRIKKYDEIALKIEKEIQQKNKTTFNLNNREIEINVRKGLDIDLYNASSSIKQLAPFLLYLRYRVRFRNELLIIDEPEMNLHPESQARLLEVLGMLVNSGVNVLLTTHSPYFMSHLNNLISGDMTDEKIREGQAKSLYLGDARAFLKPEDVSAYEMRQNRAGNQTLHDLHDKDYGIRWDTLSDVSADIQQKFFEIYEKGKEASNGKEK